MIREVSPERSREIIIETFNNFVLNYADVKKFDEIMKNRPMVEKERQKYDNTCWSLTDSLFMERIFFIFNPRKRIADGICTVEHLKHGII
jgi:hypothetical protein